MFQVTEIQTQATQLEQLGSKRKFWFFSEEEQFLFKETQQQANEIPTGEDWAEKIACVLAGRLGIPHVDYELAIVKNGKEKRGSVCKNFVSRQWSLVHGNELLQEWDSRYPKDPERKFKVVEHTIDAVFHVVSNMQLPPEAFRSNLPAGVTDAVGVFVGYLLLDTWIANQDRHHENWGALRRNGQCLLAPSFDHGASLARNLTEQERRDRLGTNDERRSISAFIRKARSAFFSSQVPQKPLPTLQAWKDWSAKTTVASDAWLERLAGVEDSEVRTVLEQIPDTHMSAVTREFTLELLANNRRRILAGDAP